MNKLEEQLISDISKTNVDYIARSLSDNEQYFHQLWQIIIRNEYKISVMAAWVWDNIAMLHPHLIDNYLAEIIEHLPKFTLDGIKRLLLTHFAAIGS